MNMPTNTHYECPEIGHAVQWAEGMMLAPQHFQQEQIYTERQMLHLMSQCQPYYWGINQLDVDASSLLSGLVVIKHLHAVMPDGLVVQYDSEKPNEDQIPLVLDLNKIERKDAKGSDEQIMVYLVVPRRTPDAASSSGGIKRFDSIEEAQIMDENSGENRVNIYRLQPKIALFAGNKVPDKYIRLPLIQVNLDDTAYQCTQYRPPSLRVDFSPFPDKTADALSSLGRKIQKCLLGLRKKASKLAQLCNKDKGDGGSVVTQNHINTISHMVSTLFDLEVLLNSENAHPFQVYQGLARLVGQLAPLSKELVPGAFLPYDHNNNISGFIKELAFVDNVIEDIHLVYSTVIFARTGEGTFELDLADKWKNATLFIEFTTRNQVNQREMMKWVNYARIASQGLQSHLSKKRVLGCETKIVDRFDSISVSPSSGSILAEVSFDESLILDNQKLQITCAKTGLEGVSPSSVILYLPHEVNGQKMPDDPAEEDSQ